MRKAGHSGLWLLSPLAVLYGTFALIPFWMILQFSLTDGGIAFQTVLHSRILPRVATNTVVISAITTVIAILLGTLLAACLWRAGPGQRRVLLGFILLPFWTAVLIKNFAWAALLQDNGLINTILLDTHLIASPLTLLHNRIAVVIGMVHYVLPYAVFPIFNAMQSIDRSLERAARSLGAGSLSLNLRIILPLILPGLSAAAILVFVVSVGFFITPIILGAPSDMMIANLVDYYVHELVDFNAGSALAVMILGSVLPLIVLQQSLNRRQHHATL